MNEGKVNMMKDEIAQFHIDFWDIGEMKWTGIGHFQSEGHTVFFT